VYNGEAASFVCALAPFREAVTPHSTLPSRNSPPSRDGDRYFPPSGLSTASSPPSSPLSSLLRGGITRLYFLFSFFCQDPLPLFFLDRWRDYERFLPAVERLRFPFLYNTTIPRRGSFLPIVWSSFPFFFLSLSCALRKGRPLPPPQTLRRPFFFFLLPFFAFDERRRRRPPFPPLISLAYTSFLFEAIWYSLPPPPHDPNQYPFSPFRWVPSWSETIPSSAKPFGPPLLPRFVPLPLQITLGPPSSLSLLEH